MLRKFSWLLVLFSIFVLTLNSLAHAQDQTTVTGTIVDSDSITWLNGTWSATLYNPYPGTTPIYTDTKQPVTTTLVGILDGSGAFSTSIPNNNAISPANTQWLLQFCPSAVYHCSTLNRLTISGSSQDVSSLATAQISPPRFAASGANVFGYSTVEINVPPVPGAFFWNTTSNQQYCWNGTTWLTSGCGTGISSGVSSVTGTSPIVASPNTGAVIVSTTIPIVVPAGLDPTFTTDNTSIFNAAIATAIAQGATVTVPCTTGAVCTYKVSPAGLTFVSNNANFVCVGPNQVIIKAASIATAPVLTIGPGSHSGLVPNGSTKGCVFDASNTSNIANGIPALKVTGAIQYTVEGNAFKNADIGFLPTTSSYGLEADNNSCGQDGTVNVCEDDEGVSGVGTGSDIFHHNNWYKGVIASAYIAGNQGNINWDGGQLGCGTGTTYNSNAAAIIWGKSYLLGTTGYVSGSVSHASFEGAGYCDAIQTFTNVKVRFYANEFGPHPVSGYVFNISNCGDCKIVSDESNLAGFWQNYTGAATTNIITISGNNPGNPHPFTENNTGVSSANPVIGTATSVNTITYVSGATFTGTGHALLTLSGGGTNFIGYQTITAGAGGAVTIFNPGVGYTLTSGQLTATYTNVTGGATATGTGTYNVALGAHTTFIYDMCQESGLMSLCQGMDSRGTFTGGTTTTNDAKGNLEVGGAPNSFFDPIPLASIQYVSSLIDPGKCQFPDYATLNTWCPTPFEIGNAVVAAATQMPTVTVNSSGTPFSYQYGTMTIYPGQYVMENTAGVPACVTIEGQGAQIFLDTTPSLGFWQAGPVPASSAQPCFGGNTGGIKHLSIQPVGFLNLIPGPVFTINSTVEAANGQWMYPFGTTNTPVTNQVAVFIGGDSTNTIPGNPATNFMVDGNYEGLDAQGFGAGVEFGNAYNNYFPTNTHIARNYYQYLAPTETGAGLASGEEEYISGNFGGGPWGIFANRHYFNVSNAHLDYSGPGFNGCVLGSGGGGTTCGAAFGGPNIHVIGCCDHSEQYYGPFYVATNSSAQGPSIGAYINITNSYWRTAGFGSSISAIANTSGGNTVYTGNIVGGGTQSYAGAKILIAGDTTSPSNNNGTFTVVSNTGTTVTLNNPNGVASTSTGMSWSFATPTPGYFAPFDNAGKQPQAITVGGIFDSSAPYTDWIPCPTNSGSASLRVNVTAALFQGIPTNGNLGCNTLATQNIYGSDAYPNNQLRALAFVPTDLPLIMPVTYCSVHASVLSDSTAVTGTSFSSPNVTFTVAAAPQEMYAGAIIGYDLSGTITGPYTVQTGGSTTTVIANTGTTLTSGGTIFLWCNNQSVDGTTAQLFTADQYPANWFNLTGLRSFHSTMKFTQGVVTSGPQMSVLLYSGGAQLYRPNGPPTSTGNGVFRGVEYNFDVTNIATGLWNTAFAGGTAQSSSALSAYANANQNPQAINPTAGTLTPGVVWQATAVASGTYTSGGTITGTTTQTCNLSALNNGSTATASVALTGTNTIAGGTALTITAPGTSATAAPTTATLSSGTATCTGTATITTVLGPVDNVWLQLQAHVIRPN